MIVVCEQTNGRHDKSRVSNSIYKKYEYRWYETRALQCRVCGGKMVPADEVDMTLTDTSESLNMQLDELKDQIVEELMMLDRITAAGIVMWIILLTVSIQLLGNMAIGASAAVIVLYLVMVLWGKKDHDRRKA